MPFYDYKCDKCGQITELMHGMGQSREGMRCEMCGMGKLTRVFHAVRRLGSSGEHSHGHGGGHSCSSCGSGACGSCH